MCLSVPVFCGVGGIFALEGDKARGGDVYVGLPSDGFSSNCKFFPPTCGGESASSSSKCSIKVSVSSSSRLASLTGVGFLRED